METNEIKNTGSLRDMLTLPGGAQLSAVAAIYCLASLALPMADFAPLTWMLLIAGVLFLYALTRTVRSVLVFAAPIAICYLAAPFFPRIPSPMLLPAAYLSLLLGGGCGAFLIIHAAREKRLWALAILPPALYGVTALVTGDPWRGLLILLPLAAAMTAAACVLTLCDRPFGTAVLTGVLVAALAAAGLVTLAVMDLLYPDILTDLGDFLRQGIYETYLQTAAQYAEMGMALGLSEGDVAMTATLFVNILPGLIIALSAVTAFLIWRLILQLILSYRSLPGIPLCLAQFTFSKWGAVIYLLSCLPGLFGGNGLFGTVCQNLTIALLPAPALLGFYTLFRNPSRSFLNTLLGIGLLILLFSNMAAALTLTACIGAFRVLTAKKAPSGDSKGDK